MRRMSRSCSGWYDTRGVDVDRDGGVVHHHVEMDRGPAAAVAVGNRQAGDRRGQLEARRRPSGRGLGRDLADAVGPQERPYPVVVSQRAVLGEHVMAHGFVDSRRGAVQEGTGAAMMLHQPRQAATVGLEVDVPVIGLADREVEHVVGVGRQRRGTTFLQVDHHATDPAILQTPARRGVVEAGRAVHLVVARQRARQGLGHLARYPGHHDLGPLQRCCVHGVSPCPLPTVEGPETTAPTPSPVPEPLHRRCCVAMFGRHPHRPGGNSARSRGAGDDRG